MRHKVIKCAAHTKNMHDMHETAHTHTYTQHINNYRIARKFGGLAVIGETAKIKSAKIYTACMYVWQYCSRLPNLNPLIHSLGANRQI